MRLPRPVWIAAIVAVGAMGTAAYVSKGAPPGGPPSAAEDRGPLAQGRPAADRPEPPPPPRGPHEPGAPWMNGKMPGEMRPLLEAGAHLRVMKDALELAGDVQRVVSNPLQATIVAVHGITELGKDNPKEASAALQALLDQEQSVAGRTVIHLGLKEILEKANDRQGALDQLVAIIKDNAQPLKDWEQRQHDRPDRPDRPGDRDVRPPRDQRPAGPQQ
jgi:hypothetical protein